jgi:exodeoxyribonuclease VII large subunit
MADRAAESSKKKSAEDIVFSVSQITEYISRKMFSDPFLSMVKVVGEVTNFGFSSIGNAYFTLKDEHAMLDCVVYDFKHHPDMEVIADGALLELGGRISFYRKNASVQLIVESAVMGGIGDLYARFERTKQKLYQEGLFSDDHKKPLPEFPLHIGVVTSPSGAVLHDIINVSTRRFDGIRITVYPVPVQGQDAAPRICCGLSYFNKKADVDVIIVARGGGSFEDLAPFNEESVVRAVYASEIPVVSAVGHETDFSLCDMAADLRAPTPSAAAELVVRDKRALIDALERQKKTLLDALIDVFESRDAQLRRLQNAVSPHALRLMLSRAEESLTANLKFMQSNLSNAFDRYDMRLERYRDRLEDLSPMRVLERGFTIVRSQDGIVTSASKTADDMEIEFFDGRIAVSRKRESNG